MKHYKAEGFYFCEDVWRLGTSTTQRREDCCQKIMWKNAQSQDSPTSSLPHQSKLQEAWLCPLADWTALAWAAAPVEGRWPLVVTFGVTRVHPVSSSPLSSCPLLPPGCDIQAGCRNWLYPVS